MKVFYLIVVIVEAQKRPSSLTEREEGKKSSCQLRVAAQSGGTTVEAPGGLIGARRTAACRGQYDGCVTGPAPGYSCLDLEGRHGTLFPPVCVLVREAPIDYYPASLELIFQEPVFLHCHTFHQGWNKAVLPFVCVRSTLALLYSTFSLLSPSPSLPPSGRPRLHGHHLQQVPLIKAGSGERQTAPGGRGNYWRVNRGLRGPSRERSPGGSGCDTATADNGGAE